MIGRAIASWFNKILLCCETRKFSKFIHLLGQFLHLLDNCGEQEDETCHSKLFITLELPKHGGKHNCTHPYAHCFQFMLDECLHRASFHVLEVISNLPQRPCKGWHNFLAGFLHQLSWFGCWLMTHEQNLHGSNEVMLLMRTIDKNTQTIFLLKSWTKQNQFHYSLQ